MKISKFTNVMVMVFGLLLTACGNVNNLNLDKIADNVDKKSEADIDEALDKLEDSVDEKIDEVLEDRIEDNLSNRDSSKFDRSATIDEMILYDENEVKIVAKSLEYKNNNVIINLELENNSGINYSITSGTLGYSTNAINGLMLDSGYLNVDLPAGKKAKEDISFRTEDLMEYGINEISEIDLGFCIADDDYNRIYSGPRKINTSLSNGKKAETLGLYELAKSGMLEKKYNCKIISMSDKEIFSSEGIKLVASVLVEDSDNKKTLYMEFVNESEEAVDIKTTNVAANDIILCSYLYFNDSINPGCRRFSTVEMGLMFSKECFDAFGLDDINNFSMDIEFCDINDNTISEIQNVNIEIKDNKQKADMSGDIIYDNNDIKIVSKGFSKGSKYDFDKNNLHWFMLVENNADYEISIRDEYDTLSINGYMIDYSMSTVNIPKGKYGLIDIDIKEDSLTGNSIKDASDVKESEIQFNIRTEDYNTIDEPTMIYKAK